MTSGGQHPQRMGLAIAAVVIAAVIGAIAWQSTRPPTVEAAVVENMAFPLPDKPSIAVLAFDNLGVGDDELLADSFSEDVLTALSKLSGLFVISRTTSFTYKGTNASAKKIAEDLGIRYVLEGSIQRDGDRIRVSAQLIDAIGGQHVWADRFDRDLTDLFAVKDDITLNIVSNISAEILQGEKDRISRRDTESLEAWLLWKQAQVAALRLDAESVEFARELYSKALSIDPDFVTALAGLGATYSIDITIRTNVEESIRKGREIFERAFEIDPDHAGLVGQMAFYYATVGENALALEFGQMAVDLNPNDYTTQANFARALHFAGRPEEAVRALRLAKRLSPEAPVWVPLFLADALNYVGDFEEGAVLAEAALERPGLSISNQWWSRIILAVAYNGLGREEDARALISQMIELIPSISTIESRRGSLRPKYVDKHYIDARLETWRRLGMPEE